MEVIDQIRQSANIAELASQYTKLQQRGRRHVGLCPFHSEKTPSFYLDDDKQLYHCFGCGAGGDIFTLVMEKENLSFPEAVRLLAEKYNIAMPESKAFSPEYQGLKESIYQVTEDALAFFRKNLNNTEEGKKALEYLHKRDIQPQIIKTLKLGYALNSWDGLLSAFKRKKIAPSILEQAGLILRRQNKEGHYDRFRGRIIFPIFNDRTGKVVAFGGRSLFDEDPKYLNSPDTPIYSKGKLLYGLNYSRDSIREQDALILVEGYTDFLSLFQNGVTNVAASLGTSLTPHQIDLIRRRYTTRIFACYDADRAGRKASFRVVSLCFEQGSEIGVTLLPKGDDPDSYMTQKGPEAFLKLVKNSSSGLKYIIDYLSAGKRPTTPEAKAKVAREVMKEINKVPDAIIRSEYIKHTSEILDIDEQEFRKAVSEKRGRTSQAPAQKSEFLTAEKRLLQIIFEDSELAAYVFEELRENDYSELRSEPILKLIKESLKKKKIPNLYEFKSGIDETLFKAFAQILQEDTERKPTLAEAGDLIDTLRKKYWQDQRIQIQKQISLHEKSGATDKISQLQKEYMDLTRKMVQLSQKTF
ncbi:MAG: DNA primase [Candidatus Aminicenantaceae bacterium]